MSMADLEEAFVLIERNEGEADFDGAKPEGLLIKAEQELGVTFPPTYRFFLGKLGCGDIAGVEFYGIINDDFENSSVPDAIWLTLDERKSASLPASHLIVGSTGDGSYYAIDCSQSLSNDENPVVKWWSESAEQTFVASDFGDFFVQSIREALGE